MTQRYPTSPVTSCSGRTDEAHYHVDRIDDCAVVTAEGQVGSDSMPALLETIDLAAAGAPRVVIDLTRVTFLDPSGLDALNAALAWARDSDEWVSLVATGGVVQTALRGAAPDASWSMPDHVDDAEVALTHAAANLP